MRCFGFSSFCGTDLQQFESQDVWHAHVFGWALLENFIYKSKKILEECIIIYFVQRSSLLSTWQRIRGTQRNEKWVESWVFWYWSLGPPLVGSNRWPASRIFFVPELSWLCATPAVCMSFSKPSLVSAVVRVVYLRGVE